MKEPLFETGPFHVPHKTAQLPLFLLFGRCINVIHFHFRLAHAGTPDIKGIGRTHYITTSKVYNDDFGQTMAKGAEYLRALMYLTPTRWPKFPMTKLA